MTTLQQILADVAFAATLIAFALVGRKVTALAVSVFIALADGASAPPAGQPQVP